MRLYYRRLFLGDSLNSLSYVLRASKCGRSYYALESKVDWICVDVSLLFCSVTFIDLVEGTRF